MDSIMSYMYVYTYIYIKCFQYTGWLNCWFFILWVFCIMLILSVKMYPFYKLKKNFLANEQWVLTAVEEIKIDMNKKILAVNWFLREGPESF